jgi:hypothetical protein
MDPPAIAQEVQRSFDDKLGSPVIETHDIAASEEDEARQRLGQQVLFDAQESGDSGDLFSAMIDNYDNYDNYDNPENLASAPAPPVVPPAKRRFPAGGDAGGAAGGAGGAAGGAGGAAGGAGKKARKSDKWSPEMNELLRTLVGDATKEGKEINWLLIAETVSGLGETVTDIQCRVRWNFTLNVYRGDFNSIEEGMISRFFKDGYIPNKNQWGKFLIDLEKMGGNKRTQKQCRERWLNHINPLISRADFTDEEDERIKELVERDGQKWSYISKTIQGEFDHINQGEGKYRPQNMIKNRWHNHIKER